MKYHCGCENKVIDKKIVFIKICEHHKKRGVEWLNLKEVDK
jgi:hypothetical protein